jgi:hypothetical protein
MKPRNNTPALIAMIAIAVMGITALNKNQYDTRPKTPQELIDEEAERRSASQPSPQPPTSSSRLVDANNQEELMSLPPEQTIGSKTGKIEIVIGYAWDPSVQADPQKARAGLMTLREMLETMNQKLRQDIQYRLVNTDIVRTVKPGVWRKGNLIYPMELATIHTRIPYIIQSIMKDLNLSSPMMNQAIPAN